MTNSPGTAPAKSASALEFRANEEKVEPVQLAELAEKYFQDHSQRVWRRTDRIFAGLMVLQWLAGIGVALWITPRTWIGATSTVHLHVLAAIFLGGAIAAFPILLVFLYPGRVFTRHVIAVSQMLVSALLIHLTGGRIETHFHIFGSLAFLAFYRDWRVLLTATIVVAVDHFLRGTYWPQSVFGTITPDPFRWMEHAGWVLFEDVFLLIMCHQSLQGMRQISRRQAELELTNERVELAVGQRTGELTKSNETLQTEISERKKAERQLHVQYAVSRALVDSSTVEQAAPHILEVICENLGWEVGEMWSVDEQAGLLRCIDMWSVPNLSVDEFETASRSMTFARGIGLPGRVWDSGKPVWIHDVVHDANFPRAPLAERADLHGAFGFPVLVENEVSAVIGFFSREPQAPDEGLLLIVAALGNQIGQFFQRTRSEIELKQMHQQLLDTSRQAGMAEVATSVLHNVGNVLNSVNVSSTLVSNQVRKSKVANLAKVVTLLNEHSSDIGAFLTSDPKGKQLPGYLGQLAENLVNEQNTVLKELGLLRENIEHIKDIVVMQQSYARVSGVVETVKISDLVENALRMNLGSLQRHGVEVLREYEDVPGIEVEKHKILQILVNLVGNAKQACDESLRTDKLMTVRIIKDDGWIKISITDNGIGIPPENLTRIFSHGFTTRKDGHGFGLHSAVLAAIEAGGALRVHSDGVGQGATFTLELPFSPPEVSAGF